MVAVPGSRSDVRVRFDTLAQTVTPQKDEGNRARFLALGMEPVLDTPEEFSAIVKTQQEKDSALVKELDLKTQ